MRFTHPTQSKSRTVADARIPRQPPACGRIGLQCRVQSEAPNSCYGSGQLEYGSSRIPVLNDLLTVDLSARRVTTSAGREVGPVWRILLLHYLAIDSRPEVPGPEVTFADLPAARTYARVYHQRVIARSCATAGRDEKRLRAAADAPGGHIVHGGDTGHGHFVGTIDSFLFRYLVRPFFVLCSQGFPAPRLIAGEWGARHWSKFAKDQNATVGHKGINLFDCVFIGENNQGATLAYKPHPAHPLQPLAGEELKDVKKAKWEMWKRSGCLTHSDAAFWASRIACHQIHGPRIVTSLFGGSLSHY